MGSAILSFATETGAYFFKNITEDTANKMLKSVLDSVVFGEDGSIKPFTEDDFREALVKAAMESLISDN